MAATRRSAAVALALAMMGGVLMAGVPGLGAYASPEPSTSSDDDPTSDVAENTEATEDASTDDEEAAASESAGRSPSGDASPGDDAAAEDEPAEDERPAEPSGTGSAGDPTEEPGDQGTDGEASEEATAEDSNPARADEVEETGRENDESDDEADDDTPAASDFAPMSASTGNSTVGAKPMTFSAYVAAGENLDIAFTKRGRYDTVPLTINVTGPGVTETCTIPAGSTPGVDCSFTDLSSGTSGIWDIDVVPTSGRWPRLSWAIDVQNGTTSIPGRVFTTKYELWQDWNRLGNGGTDPDLTNVDLDLWHVSENGYQYAASYNIYNGNGSTFVADGVGNRVADTCVPAYRSLNTTGPNVDAEYEAYVGDDTCGEPYKIFFDAPAGDLPESATRPDGGTDWLLPAVTTPAVSNFAFAPDGGGNHAGTLSFDVTDHTGAATVFIDTDGDGTFNGPDDVAIPTFVTPGSNSVDFDGLDAAGNPVPDTRHINARVLIDRAGEIHFVNRDVERRSGGLEVTALNGPDAGSTTLYWDDRFITVANRCSTTSNRDGRAGVDSTGGTHNWGRCSAADGYGNGNDGINGSWGDSRAIDDWTYHSIEEFEEIQISGVPPQLQCPAGSQLVPVDIVQNPSYEDRTGDFQNDSSDSTIGFAEHWYDSHPTGGQYHYFSPTFDSGPGAARMPVRSGAEGYGFMGGHSSGGVGEGATNTLAEPLVPGARYVGYFSMAAGGYNRQGDGYMEFFGTNDRDVGHISRGPVTPPTASNIESLHQTPVVNYPGAGVTPAWEQNTFTLVPSEAWDHLRVEVRNANPANDSTVAGQTWINFDDFHMFLCAAPVIEKTSDATEDSRPGDTVTYTVTATNPTSVDLTDVEVLDDLSGVLDDGVLDESSLSANPNTGTLDFTDPIISWEGDLGSGDTVTITYEVTLTGDGDGLVRNVAFVPPCDPADPDCDPVTPECDPPDENGRDPQTGIPCAEVEFELPRLVIDKVADKTELPGVGELVTYTVTAENVGPGDYTANAPAPVTDDLTDVLDDATLDESTLSADRPGTPTFTDPNVNWEGVLLSGATVTITYTVEYTGEGDNILLNEACVPEEETAPDADPCDSVRIPAALIEDEKSVEASDDPVVAGTVLTYTLTFENVGEAAGTVDKFDDLNHVLDDGDLTAGPTVSDATLTATGPDGDNRLHVTGTLDPDEEVTVTYEVTVKPDGERGDNVAANYLVEPGTDPLCDPAEEDCDPPPCEPAEDELPDCTKTPIGEIEDGKEVSASDDPVVAGTVLTYTLTFENVGEGPAPVDKFDDLNHVLDDGDLTAGPTVSDGVLTATGPDGDNRLHITGTLDGGDVVTVTYEVTVKPDGERGDNVAANFLVPPGTDPLCDPAEQDCDPPPCEPAEDELPDCTVTPIGEVEDGKEVSASDDPVVAGTVLTYTLTFENVGEAAAPVDKFDDLNHVLDDGDLTAGPTVSDAVLTATGPDASNRISITGTLDPGDVVTVTYEVTVKPDGERGDNQALNFLVPPGTDPLCDPAEEDCDPPPCEPAEDELPDCTKTPIGELEDWKEVDPASNTPVTAGDELTYTLTFTNVGTADVEVDKVDDLSHVLDDADLVSGPTSADAALTVTGPDGDERISITGELAPDETVTVTYTVQVREPDDRNDDLLANFLVPPGEEVCDVDDPDCDPGELCEPADDELPDCTKNPVGNIKPDKSVDPESGTTVAPGDELTYTLTFTNTGAGADEVDYTDHAEGVADDTALVDGPTASDDTLSVSGPDGDHQVHISGTLGAGETATVTYTVRVKDHDEQGDGLLENFLVPDGEEPPGECVDTNPLCTENPVAEPPEPPVDEPPGQPDLPDTGLGLQVGLLVAGAVLLAGGLGLALVTHRRREIAAMDAMDQKGGWDDLF